MWELYTKVESKGKEHSREVELLKQRCQGRKKTTKYAHRY